MDEHNAEPGRAIPGLSERQSANAFVIVQQEEFQAGSAAETAAGLAVHGDLAERTWLIVAHPNAEVARMDPRRWSPWASFFNTEYNLLGNSRPSFGVMRVWAVLFGLLAPALGFAGNSEQSNYVLVGDIPVACPIQVRRAETFVANPNLNVTPERAVTLAVAAGAGVKCNSKILQEVYADSENYYITKFGPPNSAIYTVVVNGQTGSVTRKDRR